MRIYDVAAMRGALGALTKRANEPLGTLDDRVLGIGRYVAGSSPWERHSNGDELLHVLDGRVEVELLDEAGESVTLELAEGSLGVVPRGRWHRLTAAAAVTILFASPPDEGAERTTGHPFRAG